MNGFLDGFILTKEEHSWPGECVAWDASHGVHYVKFNWFCIYIWGHPQ